MHPVDRVWFGTAPDSNREGRKSTGQHRAACFLPKQPSTTRAPPSHITEDVLHEWDTKEAVTHVSLVTALIFCAPEGTRTPNLLIRSQMLYPLSYGRSCFASIHTGSTRGDSGIRTREGL